MRTELLILLPILVPFVTAIAALLSWYHPRLQRAISLVGAVLYLATAVVIFSVVRAGGPQAVQIGGWQAPFGITIVIDLFSAIMVLIAAFMGLVVDIYSVVNIDPERQKLGFYPLYHILIMGVSGAFIAGDLFNLYVWFEVLLIASFVLLALGSERQQLEGAFKYVTLNLLASAIFLAAAGMTYGLVGTLNMADIARRLALATAVPPGLVTTLAMMFLVAFGLKAAVFPLYSWLPAAYHTPPTTVSSIFAGLLTKVGVYALIRVFTLVFVHEQAYTNAVILVLAALTMVTAVLGAASQYHFRRILSFHSSSQIGYMIMGLGLFSPVALAGAIVYILHHSIVKTNLFLVSGIVDWVGGSYELKRLGGLYARLPALSLLFLVSALSLAGIPPLSGFWAKFTLIRAGLDARQYAMVAVALLVSLLTLYSMVKIWIQAFWKPQPEAYPQPQRPFHADRAGWIYRLVPIATLAVCTIVIGLAAEPIFRIALEAANQLIDPSAYIAVVLEGS